MKQIVSVLAFVVLFISTIEAQNEGFGYQAVLRNHQGDTMPNRQNIAYKATIFENSPNGTVVFTENQIVSTDSFSVLNIQVGQSNPIGFNTINWDFSKSYYFQVELDTAGGTNYHISAVSSILSVPLSVFAKNAANANQIKGMAIASGNPADGQVLKWDAAQSQWVFSNDNQLTTIDWTNIANIPTDIQDGVISWVEIAGIPAIFSDGSLDWNEVSNKPAGFADGVDNEGLTTVNGITNNSLTISGGNNVTVTNNASNNTITIDATTSSGNYVDLTTDQSIGGKKTFTSPYAKFQKEVVLGGVNAGDDAILRIFSEDNDALEIRRESNGGTVFSLGLNTDGDVELDADGADLVFNGASKIQFDDEIALNGREIEFRNSSGTEYFDIDLVGDDLYIDVYSSNGDRVIVDTDFEVDGIAYKSGGGSWSSSSDRRLKNILNPFNKGLAELLKIRAIQYRYKKDNSLGLNSTNKYIGVIAQELKKTFPEAVGMDKEGYYTVNNEPVFWALVNAVQELDSKVETTNQNTSTLMFNNQQLQNQIYLLYGILFCGLITFTIYFSKQQKIRFNRVYSQS